MEVCIFGKKKRYQVRVAIKDNTKKIMGFAFVPAGSCVYTGYGGKMRVGSWNPQSYNRTAQVKVIAAEVIDDLELIFFDPIHASN